MKGQRFWRAYLETVNFSFDAYAATAAEAEDLCYRGWRRHAKQYQVDPDNVGRDEIVSYQVQTGRAYRDREQI